MKFKQIFKKIFLSILIGISTFTLAGCGSANFDLKKDGSGNVTLTISKEYVDPNTFETKTITKEDVETKAHEIEETANRISGMEDRVKLQSIKEENDYFLMKLKFMRIQYLSPSSTSAKGDLGIYSYKNSKDLVTEIDSVALFKDSWTYGMFKPVTKDVDNAYYVFDSLGYSETDLVPVDYSSKAKLNENQIETLFSESGSMGSDKRGKFFSFFLCDIEGLDSVTFNFAGKIKAYASTNVEQVSDSSITIKPVNLSVKYMDGTFLEGQPMVRKNVDCFIGYVYFTASPNYILIGILSFIGLALITFIIVGIFKGFFKKVSSTKKFKSIKKNGVLYFMLLPALTLIFIFSYLPMGGVILAFKNYKITDGIWNSEWASMGGFRNFYDLLTNPVSDFWKLLGNTFILAFWKFIFGFLIAIILAVLYSYLRDGLFKKTVQSISYFPYFISWVVISTISYVMLATDGGVINKIIVAFGGEAINFYASPQYWRFILTATAMWKTAGYSTIVYIAAIVSIDPSLYEAAKLDGCGRFRQLLHVTLPGLAPVIGIQIVFSLGNLVRDDFDQIYTMIRGSSMLRDTTDTIGMIVYENIGNAANYSGVAAMSLMQGLAGLVIIVITNSILKKRGIQGAY